MTDENNLLRNIARYPEDELARLAYADLMEELGDLARAEFIRLQCRLAADEEVRTLAPRERLAMKEREADLLEVHEREWAGAAADFKPLFRRGFVERVTLKVKNMKNSTQRFGALREAVPTIAGLKLEKREQDDPPSSAQVGALLNHDACRGLRELDMEDMLIGDGGAAVVAFARHLTLERLNLAGNRLGVDAANSLAGSEHLRGLRELNLADNVLRDEGIVALAMSRVFTEMRALNVSGNEFGASVLRRLVAAPWMRNLKILDVGYNFGAGMNPVNILADATCPLKLHELHMNNCGIGDIARGSWRNLHILPICVHYLWGLIL